MSVNKKEKNTTLKLSVVSKNITHPLSVLPLSEEFVPQWQSRNLQSEEPSTDTDFYS